jgi:hypothetical protein
MIVWLASYPRSGNRFMWSILREHFQFEVISQYTHTRAFQQYMANPDSARDKLVVIKTHELPAQDQFPAIYLVRDGRDAYVSYAHFELSQKQLAQPLTWWQSLRLRMDYHLRDQKIFDSATGYQAYRAAWYYKNVMEPITTQQAHEVLRYMIPSTAYFGGWNQHVLQWLARDAATVVLRFEEFISMDDPTTLIQAALQELGHAAEVKKAYQKVSPEILKQKIPTHFRRGKTGSHKDELSPELEDLFWQHHTEAMMKLNYSR